LADVGILAIDESFTVYILQLLLLLNMYSVLWCI